MKKALEFIKMSASGNDFILIKNLDKTFDTKKLKDLAKKMCHRNKGIGADGLLVWEKYKGFDGFMRIFNPDGTEPKMCGNGARCFAFWLTDQLKKERLVIKTQSSPIFAQKVSEDLIRIKMPDPQDIRLNLKFKIKSKVFNADFINTGVPHTVIFTQNLQNLNILDIAPVIRYNKMFGNEGTNVDFAQVLGKNKILVRTYERGVEDETYSCGTGNVAVSLLYVLKFIKKDSAHQIKVVNKYKDSQTVYFKNKGRNFFDIWLEGKVNLICEGKFYL